MLGKLRHRPCLPSDLEDDKGPAAELPIPPHRTQNIPEILSDLELATWLGEPTDQGRTRFSLK